MGASTPGEFLVVRISIALAALDVFVVTIWILYRHADAYWHFALGAAILAFLAIAIPKIFNWVDDKESIALRPSPKYAGKLEPKIERIFSVQGGIANRKMEIGDSGSILNFMGLEGTPLFKFWNEDEFLIESIDGKLKVSTKIRNRKGNLIAELERNEWKVAPPPQTWDRNYNGDTLEVKDETGRIVLQIRLLPDRVQLQGEWWKDETDGVAILKKKNVWGENGGSIIFFGGENKRENSPAIAPLFLYPSDMHLGELRK